MARLEEVDVDEFWLATSEDDSDDALEKIARARKWKVFRGDRHDVLSRFLQIIRDSDLEVVVRCTGDNPLTDSNVVSMMLTELSQDSSLISLRDQDYDRLPIGLVPEVFKASHLIRVSMYQRLEAFHRANVTSIFLEKGLWQTPKFLASLPLLSENTWRFTVDYPEDYDFLLAFVAMLGKDWLKADFAKIMEVMKLNPDLASINGHLRQKNYREG